MASLQQQTLMIIGGSSGIGLRVAEMAAGRWGQLDHYRPPIHSGWQKAQAQLQPYGVTVVLHRVDAHDHNALTALFATLPEFDHLVSMVGDVDGRRLS
ncbi:short chain dehydrogenase [Kluyvera cryocrescens]|uniref:Short chain dehydrogenase n=1 Tax=Kluyvera cryocrescens TaxID=580 RepID=A0A485BDU3_KLUCR|nr:short chain dehydrogenase [Kluyvera cryocrescens]